MDNDLLSIDSAALIQPDRLAFPGPWVGHIPFAAWVVAKLRPSLLVELGTHSGNSYCAMCQAIVENGVDARAFAVDTWQGDEHSFAYEEDVYTELAHYHDPRYGHFSTLLRSLFDDAAGRFDEATVDLLHIDGLHTYDAVRHDFDVWRAKVSRRGIVLLHDSHERERDFGVWRLLDELRSEFPTFAFPHSHGLGVVLVGEERDETLLRACHEPEFEARLQRVFGTLGQGLMDRYQLRRLEPELQETRSQLDAHRRSVHEYSELVASLRATIAEQERQREHLLAEVDRREQDLRAQQTVIDAVRSDLRQARRGQTGTSRS